MASPHGVAGQLGFGREVTPGTPVTVDTFLPVNEETLRQDIERIEDRAIRAGRLTSPGWSPGRNTLTGPVVMPVWNVDVALLWYQLFGAVSTVGASAPFTHTFTPGDLTGKALTWQVGLPDIGGTVRAKTWAGGKVDTWTLAANEGEAATLTVNLRAMTEATDTALAAASYDAALQRFIFTHATVTIAGSEPALVRSVSLEGNNQIVARHGVGSAASKEPLENDIRVYSGTLMTDFEDLTAYNRFVNGTEAELKIALSNGTESLEITSNVRFDGETPRLGGPERLEQTLPFVATGGSDAAVITAVLVNSDPDPSA